MTGMRIPKLALTLAAATIAGAALAQHHHMPPPAGKGQTISCAVLKTEKVNVAAATKNHMYADYKGNRYFFCCADCPPKFKANPAKYAKSPHIKIPKAKAVTSAKI